jgi:hypothetical protein
MEMRPVWLFHKMPCIYAFKTTRSVISQCSLEKQNLQAIYRYIEKETYSGKQLTWLWRQEVSWFAICSLEESHWWSFRSNPTGLRTQEISGLNPSLGPKSRKAGQGQGLRQEKMCVLPLAERVNLPCLYLVLLRALTD